MARVEVDPNYSSPTFSRATEGTDLFKKSDVQQLAAAMSTHDHTSGKGAVLVAGSIPAGSITSGMIADGTIVAGDIADGAVTSAKILDGTIVTADLANAAVTNAKLASDTARANLLTNGGFEIWQRGAGVFSATGSYTADRWVLSIGGGSTLQVSRESTVGNLDVGSQHAAACVYTHSAQSFVNQILTEQALGLRGKTLTVSLRVKTSVANAVRVDLVGNVTARVVGTYHSGSGTYQTLSTTISLDANETGLQVQVVLNASCSAWLDNAMLVVGSVAADYAPLHPADDLARCQRYYSITWMNGTVFGGSAQGATQRQFETVSFALNFGGVPTTTVSAASTWSGVNTGSTVPGIWGPNQNLVGLSITSAAAGECYMQGNAGAAVIGEYNP